jgi:cation transport ATPase
MGEADRPVSPSLLPSRPSVGSLEKASRPQSVVFDKTRILIIGSPRVEEARQQRAGKRMSLSTILVALNAQTLIAAA